MPHFIFDFLILGFMIFLLRFVAIQTAHRHMQFGAKNKANALATFKLSRTQEVAGSSPASSTRESGCCLVVLSFWGDEL